MKIQEGWRTVVRWGLVVLLSFLVGAAWSVAESRSLKGDDWPSWRGPSANGQSSSTGVLSTWSMDDNILWKVDLPGVSGATPIISGGKVFLNVGRGESLELWALDAGGGAVLWKRELGSGNRETRKQDMSSPSPVVDESKVIAMTGRGVVKAFSLDGKELWVRDLEAEYGEFGLNWGYASSPLLVGETVYVQVLHGARTDAPSYVLAIDASTGQNRWLVERPTDAERESPDSYTTPVLLPRGDSWELVISGGDYVTGHDPNNGKEAWRLGGLNPEKRGMYRIVATPMVIDNRLVVPSRVSPLLVFDTSGRGTPKLLWRLDRGIDVPSPTTDGKNLFLVDDRGIIRRFALDTGEPTWEPQRLAQGTYSGSPVVADGRLFVTSETGVTSVVKVDGAFGVVAENHTVGKVLSSLAVADGRIYLRTDSVLLCVGESAGK